MLLACSAIEGWPHGAAASISMRLFVVALNRNIEKKDVDAAKQGFSKLL